MTEFEDWLRKHHACEDGVRWALARSVEAAWRQCRRFDWLAWWVFESGALDLEEWRALTCEVAELAAACVPGLKVWRDLIDGAVNEARAAEHTGDLEEARVRVGAHLRCASNNRAYEDWVWDLCTRGLLGQPRLLGEPSYVSVLPLTVDGGTPWRRHPTLQRRLCDLLREHVSLERVREAMINDVSEEQD